jgi:GPH family glycoside/pentoside/hexuronide:cation symporter
VSGRRRTGLPLRVRLAYAAPAFALAAVGIPIYVHLPKFYTDSVGVPVATVGLVLMAARVFDGVLDPLVGAWSDRSSTRWGRRRPFLLGAALPLAAALYALFSPPLGDPEAAARWLAATMLLVFFLWTMATVPYEALGPELTFDYDQRTSLLALRDGALLAGTLVAAASPAVAGFLLGAASGPEAEAERFRLVALFYGPLIVAACAWCAWSVKEKPARREPVSRHGAGWRSMLANRPFLVLLASYSLAALGSNLPGTLILFYVEYVLESESAELFLLLYLVTGIAFLPLWVRMAAVTDKKTAWLAATAINTGAFLGVSALGAGDAAWYAGLVILSGIGFGATVAIPSAMQADVIDYDELLSGRRREGSYLGVWSVARKAAAALGVGVGLHVLDRAGYVPGAPQSEEVRRTLSMLYALLPCACNAAGFLLALAYPIGRGKHSAILDAIDARRAGCDVADPLRPGVILRAGATP